MKKIQLFILAALLLITVCAAGRVTADETLLSYTLQGGEAVITGLTGAVPKDGRIVIPDSIEGRPVTQIANGAFKNRKDITHVVLPDSIRIINNHAFDGCRKLTAVNLPEGLQYIGEYAFNSAGLTEVTFPDSLTVLGRYAFSSNYSLEEIIIPGSLNRMSYYAFSSCSGLKSAVIGEGIGILPRGIFSYCTALESVEIPDSLYKIEDSAFEGCSRLQEIRISSTHPVFSFQNGMLIDKQQHKVIKGAGTGAVHIPEGIETIGENAFAYTDITGIVFPKSVSRIESGAFTACKSLTYVTIPGHVRYVGLWAFRMCENLREIVFEEGVVRILNGQFDRCSSLQRVYLPGSLDFFGFEQEQPEHTVFVLAEDVDVAYELMNSERELLSTLPGRVIMEEDLPVGEDRETVLQGITYGWRLTAEGACLCWSVVPEDIVTLALPAKIDGHPLVALLPWCVRSGSVEQLGIPDTVTRISDNALADLPALQDISCGTEMAQAILGENKPLSEIQMESSGLLSKDPLAPVMPEGCIAVLWNGFDIPIPENWSTVQNSKSSAVWEGPDGSRLTARAGVCKGDEEQSSYIFLWNGSIEDLSWDEILNSLGLADRVHTKEVVNLNGTDALCYTLKTVGTETEGTADAEVTIDETGILLRRPVRKKPNVPNDLIDRLILEDNGGGLTMETLAAGIRIAATLPETVQTAAQDGFLIPIPDGWTETAFSVEGGRHPDKTIRVWADRTDEPETLLVAVTMSSEPGTDTVWGATNHETLSAYYGRMLRYSTLYDPDDLQLFAQIMLPGDEYAYRFLCGYRSRQVLGVMYQHGGKLLTLYYARKTSLGRGFTEQDILNSFLDVTHEDADQEQAD